jgi:uncharacterized membrane protein YqjE
MTLQSVARTAGRALLAQAALHADLLGEAWREEKDRLRGLAMALLLGFACFLCALLAVGVLLLALYWDTPMRIPAIASLLVLYGLGVAIAWRSLLGQSRRKNEALAASRDELAADLQLLRGQL